MNVKQVIKYFIVVFFTNLIVSKIVVGQTQFLFRNYTSEKYLSSNVIRSILQDSKGFMWFGTKRGLNRFDGTRVKIFQYDKNIPSSIGSDFIHSLASINDTTIWVGTDRGIFILNLKTEKFTLFSPLKGVLIYDIIKDKRGRIWIATYGRGVYCFNPKTQKIRNFDTTVGSLVAVAPAMKLELDISGNIWIATESRGIIVLDAERGSMRNYNVANSNLPANNVLTVYRDKKGDMWAGTMNGGLVKFNKEHDSFKIYQKEDNNGLNDNIVRSIYQPSPDKLFVGTEKGLNVLDLNSNRFTTYIHQHNDETSISDNAVYAIYGDEEGGIWLGTYFGGINYLRQPNPGIERYLPTGKTQNISGRAVSSFLEDGSGNMWIGTEDAGLNYFDTQTKLFKQYPFSDQKQSLPYHNLHVLTRDSKGQIWIGMFSAGLSVYNPVTGKIKTYKNKPGDQSSISSNSIYAIYEDKEKRVWVGALSGINVYNPLSDSFIRVENTERYAVYGIYEDEGGNMWFATNNYGLLTQNKRTGEWHQYSPDGKAGSLSSGKLLNMVNDGKGNLWLGTEGGGLNCFSLKTRRAEYIDEEKGIPAKVIYSQVMDEKGYLWIATERGLYSLNTHNRKVRHYSIWDGVKSLIFNYQAAYRATDGRIYMGGTNGFGVFHPDSIRNIKKLPKVILSNFQVFNKDVIPASEGSLLKRSITYTDKVILNHDQTVINIEYTGLSYVSPEKINYSYKLEGFDENWSHVGNQQKASYTNLAAGKYVFKVKADAGYENNDISETTLQIVVLPPFYKSTFAYIVYTFTAFGIFLWLSNYYRNKHQRENEIKLERLRIKNEKEFYNQKIDFFTMMAHEVRTPLSLISGPVEKLLESHEWPDPVKLQLETIDRNTDRLCSLVNQLLDFRRIESDFYELHHADINVVAQVKSIYDSFAFAALNDRSLDFTWHTSVNHLILKTDPEALTKILSNLIINALKFARSKVSVNLSVVESSLSGISLCISVEDDGIGIPREELENIFKKFFKVSSGEHQYNNLGGTGIGLALAKSLTEKLGGEMNVFSEEAKNTVFTLLFPCPPQEHSLTEPHLNDKIISVSNVGSYLLIVEDDVELQHFIEERLKEEGYSTLTASNGKEALDLMDTYDINLIISDVMMPVMGGIELCKMVKDDISRCHIPIILLTAKTDSNTELAGLEGGADVYITKPFKIKHLVVRVKNLLENRKKLMQKYARYPTVVEKLPVNINKDQKFIQQLVEFIEIHISDSNLSVESLSTEMAMSKSAFQRKMKALTDNSPNEFVRVIRLQYAAKLLMAGEYRVSEIGYMSGFASHSYFSRCFFDYYKLSPSEYIEQQHKGA